MRVTWVTHLKESGPHWQQSCNLSTALTHSFYGGDSFSSLIRVLFSKPLSSNQIFKNCQLLKTTPETCAKQSCLLVQLETWHLSREWLRGGNPFKFAHKLLTKFVKGVLQSCQICWHFSLSLYFRRDYILKRLLWAGATTRDLTTAFLCWYTSIAAVAIQQNMIS